MALLNVETAEEQTYISSGGGGSLYGTLLNYFQPAPTYDAPTASTPTLDPTKPRTCLNCTVPKESVTTVGGTPTLPPPNVVPNSPLSAVSQSGGKPTYTALAGDTETPSGAGVKVIPSDWWKYLVGAAVGYLLAKAR